MKNRNSFLSIVLSMACVLIGTCESPSSNAGPCQNNAVECDTSPDKIEPARAASPQSDN